MAEIDLPKIEEKIQKSWEASGVRDKVLAFRQGNKKFVFYEGPPTANGLPHIGHFLTRVFKDLFIRYKTMAGFFVPRKAGWDTHGLPVEIEIEKELGLKNKKEIEKYGIAGFNKKAKESVWRYKAEWEKFSKRIGFWLDFKNPYITYANDYIETLWHIIKQFDKKNFLYKGHKILHWCPRCGTALSSHEVAQGYETITEDSVIVKFKIKNEKLKIAGIAGKDTYILAWTTTPWTLPGNVALAVGKNIKYQVLSIKGGDERYILAKDRVKAVIQEEYEVISELEGKDLVGLEYEPLFEIENLKSGKSYRVYDADFVSTEDGTGVVHTAVMYGEDDYNFGEKVGLPKFHTVDKEGKFRADISTPKESLRDPTGQAFRDIGLAGKFVKDAEKDIIAYLKNKNLLFKVEPYSHEYPFCWRCKTPLLYYAADSWFVKTTVVKKQLITNNKKINWVPEYIKEGRFGQWLNEVKDWAFSRDRYWGTPLPIWQCEKCKNSLIVGSLEELEKHRYGKPNKYFILRHGESTKNDFNGKEINSTKLESDKYDLTERGVSQAKKAAKNLKSKKIDFIFASPFLRARRTAEIIGKELRIEAKINERLKEMDHGSVCEGKDHFACLPKGENEDFGAGLDVKFGFDGESRNDVRARVFSFVKEIEEKYEGKNVLVVSHGDPLWLVEGISRNLSEDELRSEKKNRLLGLAESRTLTFENYPRDEHGVLDLHRPYADEIFLKCQKCRGKMRRVPEVADVWFDSGAMPFAQNHWPFDSDSATNRNGDPATHGSLSKKRFGGTFDEQNKKDFKDNFPADFITEGVDQTRGWFYTLLAVSTLMGFGPPYKNVISLGHVLDKEGRKMSKSLGNVVMPDYVIDKFGSDVLRWWFYKVNPAGEPKRFREEELKEIQNGFVRVIVNSLRFWELYKGGNLAAGSLEFKNLTLLDRWLLSKWNSLVFSVTASLDKYDATAASREIEKFVIEDLSNWWIRRSRGKFSRFAFANRGPSMAKPSGQLKKEICPQDLLRFVLLELSKLIAPFVPFLAEYLNEELNHGTAGNIDPEGVRRGGRPYGAGISKYQISVHLCDWPKADKKPIDKKLEEEMDYVRKIVTLGLAARKEKQIRVRQPLASLKVSSFKFQVSRELLDLIKEEVNVKEVMFEKGDKELEVFLDIEISPVLRAEGWVRELVRMIQDARRDAKYDFDEKIEAHWFSEDKFLSDAIKREEKFIKQKTVLKNLKESRHNSNFVYDVEKEEELEPGRKVWLGLTR